MGNGIGIAAKRYRSRKRYKDRGLDGKGLRFRRGLDQVRSDWLGEG